MNIIIFSRPVRSGKTTELMEWCKHQENIDGILMPDVNGSRWMQKISTGERWEAQHTNNDITSKTYLTIGRFSFYKNAFAKANDFLIEAASTTPFLVIDEIGKLELQKEGFYQSLKTILHHQQLKNLLLVVRDNLVSEVADNFQIKDFQLLHQCSDIAKN